ncbi:LOW QUALITY PROTEIN: hypothetical protein HJC23_010245 [Cyclotella cryptica]|uniref:Uncharacterized protein n=1 Tax=Cyclotella cryptica TaxID=29204 RepID=A0ABD3PZT0_9STRA
MPDAAARARAQKNTIENSPLTQGAGPFNADELTNSAGSPVSPSSQFGTPTSLTTSLSPIECGTPPTHNGTASHSMTPSHNNKSLSSSLDKFHAPKKNGTSGCSGASTVTTDATTASIGSGFRRLRLSPVHDVHEGEVAEAMRESDRVKRFNNVHEKANNHQVGRCRQLKEEDDENDTKDDDGIASRGPLNHQVKRDEHQSSLRTTEPKSKHPYQTQLHSSSSEKSRHGWKNNILKTAAKQMELRYYRVVYPGVVSLVSEWNIEQQQLLGSSQIKSEATSIQSTSETNGGPCNNNRDESASGVYLGYGEVIATSSPEITIPVAESEKLDNCEHASNTQQVESEKKCIRAIKVESILTGGYTIADDTECVASNPSVSASWKNSSMRHYGYLLLSDRLGRTIAEAITPTKPGSVGPSYESGPFVYRVRATSPVRVLSGPDFHAPSMRFALLPGTVHDISFRVSLPVSDPISDNDASDILVDDADAGEVKFLRLSHRRGWVADRRVEDVDGDSKRLRVSYLMQDVTDDAGIANASFSNSYDSSSLNSSLHSKSNSSFYHSVTASSVATPPAVNAQRKRTNRRRREAFAVPITFQESRQAVGESFDTESSVTGYGGGTIVSSAGDSIVDPKSASSIETYYLMRVLAPLGLKILDAPHFQVSNLIHTPSHEQNKLRSQSPVGISPFARTNAMIGSTSAEGSPSSIGGNRRSQRIRFLARGQFFEASQRMETTDAASLYTNGQGLIKLADGSGWVIIPHHNDLVAQYQNFRGVQLMPMRFWHMKKSAMPQYTTMLTPPDRTNLSSTNVKQSDQSVIWLRVVAPNGIKVLLPPSEHANRTNNKTPDVTPPKYVPPGEKAIGIKPSSSSHESEVASAVGSSFFESVWNKVTPTKQKERHLQVIRQSLRPTIDPPQPYPVIPCGMVVPVEYSDSSGSDPTERRFVRLYNGQGWIPRRVGGTLFAVEVDSPEVRFGSFWFRVQSRSGIDVRHGPSSQAPFITSDCGHSFRFECGEFLRSSEVLTIFNRQSDSTDTSRAECFARLYRMNQNLGADAASKNMLSRYSSLQPLTFPGEWVMVHDSDELFLEECSAPPSVERNRECWRCSAIRNINIRLGPSFGADLTGKVILAHEEFYVTEKVTASGDQVTWFRLKNNEGWVHSITESGDPVVHCHVTEYSRKFVRQILNGQQHAF